MERGRSFDLELNNIGLNSYQATALLSAFEAMRQFVEISPALILIFMTFCAAVISIDKDVRFIKGVGRFRNAAHKYVRINASALR